MNAIKNLISKILLNLFLKIYYELYFVIDKMTVRVHGGLHPKKAILKYEDWFLSQISEGATVVDIGSNNGFLANHLSQKARHVYGIEISKGHFEEANQKKVRENITYFNSDATTFDYDGLGSVDFITLSNVLEHIKERVIFLKKIIGANSKNTKFLIRIPTVERDWIAPYMKSKGMPYFLDPTHFIEHTEVEARQELTEAGLNIESLTTRFGEFYLVCSIK